MADDHGFGRSVGETSARFPRPDGTPAIPHGGLWKADPMDLHLSRDSVAAGDDVESHDKVLVVDRRRPLELVLMSISRDRYLPRIFGGRASWLAVAGRRGPRLAVMAEQWDRPLLLVNAGTAISQIGGAIDFEYHAQIDPNELLTC